MRIVLDDSNLRAAVLANLLQDLLAAFGRQVAAGRLVARGLDPALLTPIRFERLNVASARQMGGSYLGMFVPMFVILFAFLGGMYTAIDVTAGEKERGTLEPLLTAPVSRLEVVLGKLLAVCVTSFSAVLLALLSTYAAFQLVPGDLFGARMSFVLPAGRLLWLILATLPLTLMLSSVEMMVCIYARSFKEAQNYVTPLQLLLMLPALLIGLIPGLGMPAWSYALPALGQIAVFRSLLGDGPLNHGHLALGLASATLYALLAVVAAARTFEREDVLFRA